MFRLMLVLAALSAVVTLPGREPDPGDLALVLGEEEWNDYLDKWLANEERNRSSANVRSDTRRRNGCTLRVNGDLGTPQPVYIHGTDYLQPTGTTGEIHLGTGEEVLIACPGSGRTIQHPALILSGIQTARAACVSQTLVSGAGWLSGSGVFAELTCSSSAYYEARATNNKCFNDKVVIEVGFDADGVFYPLYWSCFDQSRLEVLYVTYKLSPPNAVHQTGVNRPDWAAGSFFPGVTGGINSRYSLASQRTAIANIVGTGLANQYVTGTQFLSRGHLAAMTDFVFATGQRATFFFINAAPQWQPFNAGNWNWLEQDIRFVIGASGHSARIYTGTFGVSQLRDGSGVLRDIYLYRDANNNQQLPVPLYYYKVVYDEARGLGTAFVSINNPYYTAEEVRSLTFCTDRCRNNPAFSWLRWKPDDIEVGYSFCCEIDDFRRTVNHLPEFSVNGLFSSGVNLRFSYALIFGSILFYLSHAMF